MRRLDGAIAAPGMARGRVVRLEGGERSTRIAESPDAERTAMAAAMATGQEQLTLLLERAGDDEAGGILAFQLALLEDEEITRPTFAHIENGESADRAWSAVLDVLVADYERAEDGYFRARASDLRDLRERVLNALCGEAQRSIPPGAIVFAEDLSPSRFLATEWDGGGLVLQKGGTTGHVAILARARGVPMLVGVDVSLAVEDAEALLDADAGWLMLEPDAPMRAAFEQRLAARSARAQDESRQLDVAAVMTNGERVRVMINVARPEDLRSIDPTHTDGIGLVRSEFLFEARDSLPSEEEQYQIYRRIVQWAAGRPVTIRTLDAGGDKPIAGVTRTGERNPFLGMRGVRLSLQQPDIFLVQLRALGRAAVEGNVKVMVPMVTLPEELSQCRLLLQSAVDDLRAAGVPARLPPLGMMVEVPAAALAIEQFDADFYSIGSNDLMQYLAAASRDEPELGQLASPGPACWRVLRELTAHGRAVNREVSLCGDLASDTRHVPELLRCGLRALSVAPAALAALKAAVRRT